MIMQYLADEGYNASQMTIQDESNVKWHEREENTNDTLRLKKAILGKVLVHEQFGVQKHHANLPAFGGDHS
jgi:hypothetical protein